MCSTTSPRTILEIAGGCLVEVAPRDDYGAVRIAFYHDDHSAVRATWSSEMRRLTKKKKSLGFIKLMSTLGILNPVLKALAREYPKWGYLFADPEVRQMFMGKSKPVDPIA